MSNSIQGATVTVTIFDAINSDLKSVVPIATSAGETAYLEEFVDSVKGSFTETLIASESAYEVVLPDQITKNCLILDGSGVCVQEGASTTFLETESIVPIATQILVEGATAPVPSLTPTPTPLPASIASSSSAIAPQTTDPNAPGFTLPSGSSRVPPRFAPSSIIAVTVILALLLITFIILAFSLRRRRKVEDAEGGFKKSLQDEIVGKYVTKDETKANLRSNLKTKKADEQALKITPFRISMWPSSKNTGTRSASNEGGRENASS